MADKIRFELVSPERLLMAAPADMVVVPGADGEFGVLAGHVPLASTLKAGVVTMHDDGKVTRLYVRGGFADVAADTLTILAEEAIALDDLDLAALDQRLKDLAEDIADAKSPDAKAKAQADFDHWQAVRAAA